MTGCKLSLCVLGNCLTGNCLLFSVNGSSVSEGAIVILGINTLSLVNSTGNLNFQNFNSKFQYDQTCAISQSISRAWPQVS